MYFPGDEMFYEMPDEYLDVFRFMIFGQVCFDRYHEEMTPDTDSGFLR